MLELPEIETIRRDLEREVSGKRIKSVEVHATKPLAGITKKAFVDRLTGAKVEAVTRRGLLICFRLDTGELLAADMGDSGQFLRAQGKDPLDKATAVVISFTQGGQLRFRDAKGTASLTLTTAEGLLETHKGLTELGLDPVEEPLSWTTFGHLLFRRRAKLKPFLTDPTTIVGIGDVYGDEILWAAGLRYDRASETLSTQEIRRLYRSLVETLHDAVKYGGTTLSDEGFVDVHGKRGGYNEHLQVVEREKEACRRCRGVVAKVRFQNHPTYFCPSCQT